MQNSVDTVQVLLRKQEEFEHTCQAHDEKIKQLCDQANKLIHGGNYDIPRYVIRSLPLSGRKGKLFKVTNNI